MLIKASTIKGYKLRSRDGEFGSVDEFYFDDKHWGIRYLIADTGGWLTGRQVLISPYAMLAVNPQERSISVDLTKKQIEDGPSPDSHKPVSRQFEEAFHGFYGWPMYWGGPFMWGPSPYLVPVGIKLPADTVAAKAWDSHLRSTHSVIGLSIHATDGEIGKVDDFVIDDETWAIRYLIIDTHAWWAGKKVLISPRWISGIHWDKSEVSVFLSREAIRQSPEYRDGDLIVRNYEEKLHGHYNHKTYWADEQAAQI